MGQDPHLGDHGEGVVLRGLRRLVADYPARPWFADALPLGEVLVRADRTNGWLSIGVLGTPRLVTAVPD